MKKIILAVALVLNLAQSHAAKNFTHLHVGINIMGASPRVLPSSATRVVLEGGVKTIYY